MIYLLNMLISIAMLVYQGGVINDGYWYLCKYTSVICVYIYITNIYMFA